jgi:hypothetical protein
LVSNNAVASQQREHDQVALADAEIGEHCRREQHDQQHRDRHIAIAKRLISTSAATARNERDQGHDEPDHPRGRARSRAATGSAISAIVGGLGVKISRTLLR